MHIHIHIFTYYHNHREQGWSSSRPSQQNKTTQQNNQQNKTNNQNHTYPPTQPDTHPHHQITIFHKSYICIYIFTYIHIYILLLKHLKQGAGLVLVPGRLGGGHAQLLHDHGLQHRRRYGKEKERTRTFTHSRVCVCCFQRDISRQTPLPQKRKHHSGATRALPSLPPPHHIISIDPRNTNTPTAMPPPSPSPHYQKNTYTTTTTHRQNTPQKTTGHNSVLLLMEAQTNYILSFFRQVRHHPFLLFFSKIAFKRDRPAPIFWGDD